MSVNIREAALNSVIRCEKDGRYSNLELDAAIKKYGLTGVDRSFFSALVYGVIERKITLDFIISLYSDIALDKIDLFVLNALRLGAYQILFMSRVPDSAAVNESVEQVKRRSNAGAASFVNAMLRKIAKNKDTLPFPRKKDGFARYLSIKYSLPEWLCGMWREMYGEESAEKAAEASNRRPHVTLRANTLKITPAGLVSYFAERGVPSHISGRFGVTLEKDVPVRELPIDQGLCYVQDAASQLCTEELAPLPGETVIDACACPGGKSFACALLMEDRGEVLSFDLHKNKLSLVEEGAKKLGISIIKTSARDATILSPELLRSVDRVLCDVPCSGLGVIARKPDLRYKTPEDLLRLPQIQYEILKTSAEYVKAGGVLMYSTCTLNKNENEEIALRFLGENKEFEPDGFGMKTLFFNAAGDSDGFFTAKFKRIK